MKMNENDTQKLKKLYQQLGEVYYQYGNIEPIAEFTDITDKIASLFAKYDKCPNCGAELEDDALYCDMCGTRIGVMGNEEQENKKTVCRYCGNPVRNEAKFCGACGHPVE